MGMFAYGAPIYSYGGTGGDPSLGNAEAQQQANYATEGVRNSSADPSLYAATAASQAQAAQSRLGEQGAYNTMAGYANGGQTAAMKQAAQTQAYNQAAQGAMVSNAGSPQALAAARATAGQTAATAGANSANSNAALAAQERQTYAGQAMTQANTMRQNDNSMYSLNNNAAYQQAQDQATRRAANDQLTLNYSALKNANIGAQQQIQLGNGNFNLQQNQQNYNSAMKGINASPGALGGLGSGIGGAWAASGAGGGAPSGGGGGGGPVVSGGDAGYSGSFNSDVSDSDERVKTNIQRGGLMSSFLDTLAHSRSTYQYKDPSREPRAIPNGGRYAGVMAQDLERVPEIGSQLVIDTPDGKKVDQKTLTSALSAAMGEVHERVRRLEGNR